MLPHQLKDQIRQEAQRPLGRFILTALRCFVLEYATLKIRMRMQ
ncbi:hypothetical protein IFVP203_C2190078 [Vibrio parahaemolyticus]